MEIFMTTVLLHSQNLEYLKKLSRKQFPSLGSSHLTEAIATGLGFKKHASLIAALDHPTSRLHAVAFSNLAFRERTRDLANNTGKIVSGAAEYSLQFDQDDLPVPCWQPNQSDTVYFKYSRLNLPIIFIKDRKQKYCTLDYDYHFPSLHEVKEFDFGAAKDAAIPKLGQEYRHMAKTLDMPKSFFEGTIVTGWVKRVPIKDVRVFADRFALVYFSLIRELEDQLAIHRPPRVC
jgi:hypothetical protein